LYFHHPSENADGEIEEKDLESVSFDFTIAQYVYSVIYRAGGQGRGEAIHPPSRAGRYSGIFL